MHMEHQRVRLFKYFELPVIGHGQRLRELCDVTGINRRRTSA
jgi:hypothetical protein